MKALITGANGQLGGALQHQFPDALALGSRELDITDSNTLLASRFLGVGAIINAAAYTNVDGAENPANSSLAEAVNSQGVANLAQLATRLNIPLIHFSSDYVFDGTKVGAYTELDPFKPVNTYGRTKANGDLAAAEHAEHYIFRTSWVVGNGPGPNFVKTMAKLAEGGVDPAVINDQFGRLTFTKTLAGAVQFALENEIPYGTYNLTNSGDRTSWFQVAQEVFRLTGNDPDRVSPQTSAEYASSKDQKVAPRPTNSMLDLSLIKSQGFHPADWRDTLETYLNQNSDQVNLNE
jgi:dTDP-4-dehydrorhamnose reductase